MAEEKVDVEKEEIREQMRALEKNKCDLESKVNFLLRQEADLKDALEKVSFWSRGKRINEKFGGFLNTFLPLPRSY